MKQMQWFRLYNRIIDNDKVRLLAFEDRWHFVAICCLKSAGVLEEPDSDLKRRRLAVKMGVQVRELEEIQRRLMAVELVDENLVPVAWSELQYETDNSTSRVRKHREKAKKKQARNAVKQECNVSVTPPETETETDITPKGVCETSVSLEPKHIVEEWNKVAKITGKPLVRDLTPERRQLLKARIRQYSLDDFITVIGKLESSKFLRGDTGWNRATFDWIFKKANFQKALEGNYDE